MLFSIIIPCYNVSEYINRCVNSILNQEISDFELILVNDGSMDNTLDICNEIASKDSRVIVINKENGGVSSARNKGLEIARAEYIMFIDGDDTVTEDFLLDFKNYLSNFKYDAIINLTTMFKPIAQYDFRDKESLYIFLQKNFRHYLNNVLIVYKKSVINKLRFNEEVDCGEDFLFNFEVFKNVESMLIPDKSYYNYIIRDNSLSQEFRLDHLLTYEKRIAPLKEFLHTISASDNLINTIEDNELKIALFHQINQIVAINCKFTFRKRINLFKQIVSNKIYLKKLIEGLCEKEPSIKNEILKLAVKIKYPQIAIIPSIIIREIRG